METSTHLKIAEPCHENWQDMTQQEQGRHCEKCCKVVVDFTSMPTEKVIAFISERKSEKICGRFRSEQIALSPRSHVSSPLKNRYRVFFAALYFVFGGILFTSCKHQEERMGKVAIENSFAEGTGQFPKNDSPVLIAKSRIDSIPANKKVTGSTCIKPDTTNPGIYKMGEVEYVLDTIHK